MDFQIQYRQGDIFLESIPALPKEVLIIKQDGLLGTGEGSGHGHYITGHFKAYSQKGVIYVEVIGDAALEHLEVESGDYTGEHKKIDLEKGVYQVTRQRSLDPYTEAIKVIYD